MRGGSVGAFAVLYDRHRQVALDGARRYLSPRHRSLADDVVEVTFSAIYDAFRRGSAPKGPFRSYLLLSVRREARRQQARRDRETVVDTQTLDRINAAPAEGSAPAASVAAGDPGAIDPELLLGDVFSGLNERFRHALWLSEVEGRRPEELAPLLGISANAAAALCYRARRALRSGYFTAYAATLASATCKPFIDGLAEFVEAGQPPQGHDAVRVHLAGCATCRDVARGSARSGSVLAALGPFGLLGAGRWLEPGRAEAASVSPQRSRREVVSAVAVVVLLLALAAVAAWPGERGAPGSGEVASVPSTESSDPAEAEPSEPSADEPPVGTTTVTSAVTGGPASAPTTTVASGDPVTGPLPGSGAAADPSTAPSVGWIQGTVTADRDGGGPALAVASAGTPVRIIDADGTQVMRANTGLDGAFLSGPLAPGTYAILVTRPVGMVASFVDEATDGSTRREARVAEVAVVAGTTVSVDPRFVPWRRFTISGGSASRSSLGVGEVASWAFEASSPSAAVPGAIAELTIAHPAGTVLGFEWAAEADGPSRAVADRDAAEGEADDLDLLERSACSVERRSRST
ncbi:MAG: sigma-70 family RNA polymerase sigma factor, partial [Acidimicrobiales bacterium]|nr:sigma-70 family RNA polymerase sigma factor [Acidimicrobiales bacterium]